MRQKSCARFFEQSRGLVNIPDRAFRVVLSLFAACFTEWYSRRVIFIWCRKWRMVWSVLTGNCCRPVDKCLYVENLFGVPVGKVDEMLAYTGRCLRQEALWLLASETPPPPPQKFGFDLSITDPHTASLALLKTVFSNGRFLWRSWDIRRCKCLSHDNPFLWIVTFRSTAYY